MKNEDGVNSYILKLNMFDIFISFAINYETFQSNHDLGKIYPKSQKKGGCQHLYIIYTN